MKGCSIEGCLGDHLARGWCNRHYLRWKRHGDPEGGEESPSTTPEERFERYTIPEPNSGCILWIGTSNPKGYGRMWVEGKRMYPHRYAWERDKGAIPKGLVIDHLCHTPPCVNVEHLRVANKSENAINVQTPRRAGASGEPNVTWDKAREKWKVQIRGKGFRFQARYDDLEEAKWVARKKREELQGA